MLDPTAGILLMATRQGAPSQRALTALSKTFSLEKTMKFKEIPNNDGVRLFYESSSPEINRITVELPSPDAEFLQRVLMLPEGKIMEMLTDGVAHVDLVLKPEPRNAMLKGTQAVREAIAHLQRHLPGFDKAVASLDMNGLKQINDTQGHEAGDAAIAEVGRCLRRANRHDTTAYRVGGDEFVIVFVQQSEAIVARTLEKLKRSVTRSGYSISAGYAMVTDNESVEAALRESDQNMYKEKAAYYQQKGMDRRKRI